MSKFITVTLENKDKILLNMDFIISISSLGDCPCEENSTIKFKDEDDIWVMETFEELEELCNL